MGEENYIGYKIDTKHTYKVYTNENNGNRFYQVQIKKKNYDGSELSVYKQLRFVKCNPPENGEIIKIHKGFEDLYIKKGDRYNPISIVVVTEYELVNNKAVNEEKAYSKYQETIGKDTYDFNFDSETNSITDADLPF